MWIHCSRLTRCWCAALRMSCFPSARPRGSAWLPTARCSRDCSAGVSTRPAWDRTTGGGTIRRTARRGWGRTWRSWSACERLPPAAARRPGSWRSPGCCAATKCPARSWASAARSRRRKTWAAPDGSSRMKNCRRSTGRWPRPARRRRHPRSAKLDERVAQIPAGSETLEGNLSIPDRARAVILFAHGSGSRRHSPRNRFVARVLNDAGLATLVTDLLTADEEEVDEVTRHLRFDITLLAQRLVAITDWLAVQPEAQEMRIGYFGASTGAAAALVAAAERPAVVGAIVSRGGRPDLAGPALPRVRAPTLLIVGGNDLPVLELNRQALRELRVEAELSIVPGATHLFEEPGALEEVARLSAQWFTRHLGGG